MFFSKHLNSWRLQQLQLILSEAAQPDWKRKKVFFMKNRTIRCLIYLSTLPVLSFAQQANTPVSRTPDAVQSLEIQRGELEFFKTIVYRYEVAWEESDLESMVDLRDGLLKLMGVEAKQLEDKTNLSKTDNQRLVQQRVCIKNVEAAPLSLSDSAFGKKAEANNATFKDFIRLLEEDFSEQAAALRQ